MVRPPHAWITSSSSVNAVFVFSECSLRHYLSRFLDYYHQSRTHLGLHKDAPEPRPVQGPGAGRVVAFPEVGGLHHRYERRAA
jgi:putative transposase